MSARTQQAERPQMPELVLFDREVIDSWIELGAVPENYSSREFAVKIIGKLVADLDEMHAVVDQLFDEEPRLFVITESKEAS